MRGLRDGFSLLELMIVLLMVAGLTALSAPRIASLRDSSNIGSARAQVTATLAAARTAAIQKGRPALFIKSGNEIRAIVPNGALAPTVIAPRLDLNSEYKVQLLRSGGGTDTIAFDARGLASPRLTGTGIYHLVGATRRDSVCVGVVGQLYPRGCAP